jgi:hypothetical protein
MQQEALQARFAGALDRLVEQIQRDRAVLAAILCGSLSHDTVWARSDIDLVLVTVDDRPRECAGLALYADGMNVHTILISRAEFRKTVEGSIRNSFMHSFLTKGRLLYSHDPTVADLFATLTGIGDRDRRIQVFRAATGALPPIYKAHKWFVTRGDLDYTALWILYAATSLAKVEVISAGLLADREVIPQALRLNPDLFGAIYSSLLNAKKTRKAVQAALDTVDAYIADRAPRLFAPVLEYLSEVSEARSCTEIETHFKRTFDIEEVTTACEYLADQGLIGKASTPVRLTRKSTTSVQELAFYSLESAVPQRTI